MEIQKEMVMMDIVLNIKKIIPEPVDVVVESGEDFFLFSIFFKLFKKRISGTIRDKIILEFNRPEFNKRGLNIKSLLIGKTVTAYIELKKD